MKALPIIILVLLELAYTLLFPSTVEYLDGKGGPVMVYKLAVVLVGNAAAYAMWIKSRNPMQVGLMVAFSLGCWALTFSMVHDYVSIDYANTAPITRAVVAWNSTALQFPALLVVVSGLWFFLGKRAMRTESEEL